MTRIRPTIKTQTVWLASMLVVTVAGLSACDPPRVVDLGPADLDATISVIDIESSPSDGKVIVSVQVSTADGAVQLGGDASITVNGEALAFNGILGYLNRIPMVAPGGIYSVVHTRGGVPTVIANVTAPQRPQITTPSDGQLVPRTSTLMIMYAPGAGTHVSGRAAGQKAGAGTVSVGADDQPDDGSYGPLSSLEFDPGPGRVSLTRTLKPTPPPSSFRSVQITYNVGNENAVTWQ